MNQLEIFCVTNKQIPHLEKSKYKLAAVGMNKFSDMYLTCDTGDNIFDKEKYYSELTFSLLVLEKFICKKFKKLDWLLSKKKIFY